MKIQFTLTLSDRTVAAIKQEEGARTSTEVKNALVRALKDYIGEIRSMVDEDEDDE